MRFGICGSMVVSDPRLGGSEIVPVLARAGYDYIELSLTHLTRLDDASFQSVRENLENTGMPCECCNNFFPAEIKLTGPDSDVSTISEYAERAMKRAADLGVKNIVLGSGRARQVPEGYPYEKAWQQLVELCRLLGGMAERRSLTIVLEPLRKEECNILQTVKEALQLSKEAGSKRVKVLADYYHMKKGNESPHILLEAGKDLLHVHFANPAGRVFPFSGDEDDGYSGFFSALRKINYNERISVEAYSSDLERDARMAIGFLKSIIS